jgi:amino acid transporter
MLYVSQATHPPRRRAGVTVVKLGLLLFVSVASFTQGSGGNLSPFMNTVRDVDGIFLGASSVFFTFTGVHWAAFMLACLPEHVSSNQEGKSMPFNVVSMAQALTQSAMRLRR